MRMLNVITGLLTAGLSGRRPGQAKSAVPVLLVLLAAVSGGCHRRPLEDMDYNTRLKVKINVEAISNVTCDIYNDKIPVPEIQLDVMHAVFFDAAGGQLAAETYLTAKGTDEYGNTEFTGDLSLSPGEYNLYSCNFGTEATLISEPYNWGSVKAYALDVPSRISGTYATRVPAGESITYSPDHLLVARNPQEVIPYHTGVHTVYAEARTVVESYYLQIKVDGLQYVNSASAVISGLSSANFITLGDRVDDPKSTVWFTMQKSDDDGVPVICTVFNTFGRPEGSDNSLEVTFDIVTRNGSTVQRTFDISDLFLSENCVRHHWLLLDETITIDPPEPDKGGGFDPKVDDWEDEHHDIIL